MPMTSVGTPVMWIGFIAFVLAMLAIDLGVLHREAKKVRMREAAIWTVVWISLAMVFAVGIFYWFGSRAGWEFVTGYLIEKALSVDNLFVFLVLFSYFSVPDEYQHRVLFWGILGALLMRALFIGVGTALLSRFHWMMYVFGGFLIITGGKLLVTGESEVNPETNPVIRLVRRCVPMVSSYHGSRFTVVLEGRRWATPLLLVLVVIEVTDVIFALDSLPAIFAVTLDPFIVFTSNIFAILGLRALFFLLSGMMGRFRYLNVGLAFVLLFVGVKMLIAEVYKVPIGVSLAVIAGSLVLSVVASIFVPEAEPPMPKHIHDEPPADPAPATNEPPDPAAP